MEPGPKKPRKLAELCHDALVEGVIEKHEGLPASWLERFKEDDRVMAQLQTLVMESDTREDLLTKDSLVTIVVMNSGRLSHLHMWQTPAGNLGAWQYGLLDAYFQGMQWSGVACDPEEDISPEREPLGGYQIGWNADDLKPMWGDLVRWHHGYCKRRRSSMYVELTHTLLLDCFDVDIKAQYAGVMHQKELDHPNLFEGWKLYEIIDYFPQHTERVVLGALCNEVTTRSKKQEWVTQWLFETKPDPNDPWGPPHDRALQRASFCTVFVDMRH